jgi:hypothetical protein
MIDYFNERMSATGPGSPDLAEGILLSFAAITVGSLILFALAALFLQYKKLVTELRTIEHRLTLILFIIPWGIYLFIPVLCVWELYNKYVELGRKQ